MTQIWNDIINWFSANPLPVLIGFFILAFVIFLLIYTIFLKIALGFADAKNTGFGAVFVTALVNTLLLIIPCIGCILNWVVINSRHDTGFAAAIGVWILAIVIGFLIIWGISLVFGLTIPLIP